MRALRMQLKELGQLRDKAYEDKLKGVISNERWNALESAWSEREARLSTQLEDLELGKGPAEDEAEATFKLLERAPKLYLRQTHEARVRFLKVLTPNSILIDKKVDPF